MKAMKKYSDYVFMLREKYKGIVCLSEMTNKEIETFCNLFVAMRNEEKNKKG